MSYETAEILDEAADVIERDGWHQGDYAPRGCRQAETTVGLPVCALGAIAVASGRPHEWATGIAAWLGGFDTSVAAGALIQQVAPRSGDIPSWNDAPERTKQEVLDALRLAAKNERAAEDQS